jgi:phage protein D
MIWTYATVRNPVYYLWINGKQLTDEQMAYVEEVVYEDHATGSDICSVTISDPKLEFISDPVIASRASFKLTGGYQLRQRTMLSGYISAVDYLFPEDNTPQLVIHAMDKSHLLDRTEVKKTFSNKSRLEVARSIAQANGYGFSGQGNKLSNKKEETLSQSYQTDMAYLISLADECEMIVYLKDNTIYFHERNYGMSSSTNLVYRDNPFNLISFEPRLVQKDVPDEEEEDDIDDEGKNESGKANSSTPSTSPGGKGKPYNEVDKDNGGGSKIVYEDGKIVRK